MKICILVLSFGDGPDNHGAVNKALAAQAVELSLLYGKIPIIAQWEVAENIAEDLFSDKVSVHSISPDKAGGYMTTRTVLRKAKKVMAELGCEQALLLAHPEHLPRAKYTASGFMQEGIDLYIPYICNVKPLKVLWDENSTQPWTRNKKAFRKREMVAKVLTFLHII